MHKSDLEKAKDTIANFAAYARAAHPAAVQTINDLTKDFTLKLESDEAERLAKLEAEPKAKAR